MPGEPRVGAIRVARLRSLSLARKDFHPHWPLGSTYSLAIEAFDNMKAKLILLSLAALATLGVHAQAMKYVPATWTFSLDGASYVARISRDAVVAAPTWDPSKPLPLSFGKAETVARAELRKLVGDEPAWRVRSFEIVHLEQTASWYYVVDLKPLARREKKTTGFYVLIDLSGKAGPVSEGRLEPGQPKD